MRKYQIGEPVVGQRDAFDPGVVPVRKEVVRRDPKRKREPVTRPPRIAEPVAAQLNILTFGGPK
jgi:hypothetical protein